MRAIAACQFTLSRFEAWRCAVVALTGCVILVLSLWFIGQPETPHGGVAAALGLVALAALGLGASLLPTRAVSVRWDGRDWHAGPADAVGQEPLSGALSVSVDLGSWMLLRFQPDAPARRFGATWLPVQRRGLEPQWHALRCAVYSPRPARDAALNANAAAEL
jgi:hypothetical protein